VIVGVVREEDKKLVLEMVDSFDSTYHPPLPLLLHDISLTSESTSHPPLPLLLHDISLTSPLPLLLQVKSLPSHYRDRIFVKYLNNLNRPANLPFGLIMWAKRYILQFQCHYRYTYHSPHHLIHVKHYREPTCPDLFKSYSTPTNTTNILLHTLLGTTHEATEISDLETRFKEETISQNLENFLVPSALLTHIYYTESDQLLQIESPSLRNMILESLNISVHLIGRRREKVGESDPLKPLQNMYPTRSLCGNVSALYVLDSEKDRFIRRES
jgi:hypothetical protein